LSKLEKPIQSDSFFLHLTKNKHFLCSSGHKKKLNLKNQTKATQNKQIKLKLRNPYKEKSTNPYKRNQAANGDKRKPHTL